MKSQGDPILDAKTICATPKSREEIERSLATLGWGVPVDAVLDAAIAGGFLRREGDKFVAAGG